MRAKLDENVPVEAAELLRAAGWNCETVYGESLAGADDGQVAAVCQAEARVLFTLDLDFADIRTSPPSDYAGSLQQSAISEEALGGSCYSSIGVIATAAERLHGSSMTADFRNSM